MNNTLRQWDVRMSRVSVSAWDYPLHPDREDEKPLGLMRGLSAAARVTGLGVQRGKRDAAHRWKTKLEPGKNQEFSVTSHK